MRSASAGIEVPGNGGLRRGIQLRGQHHQQRQQKYQQRARASVPFLQSVRVNKDYSRAPEVHAYFGCKDGKAVYDAAAADVWGLGILLFFLLVGKKPVSFFECALLRINTLTSTTQCSVASDMDTTGRWRYIAEGRVAEMPIVRQVLANEPVAVQLLQRILRVDPSERPTASEILEDAWML